MNAIKGMLLKDVFLKYSCGSLLIIIYLLIKEELLNLLNKILQKFVVYG